MFDDQFADIDNQEHELYQTITNILNRHDSTQPPENQTELFDAVRCHYQESIQLQEKHAQSVRALVEARGSIWVQTITQETTKGKPLIPPHDKTGHQQFLTNQYYLFINQTLDLSKITPEDAIHIQSYVLKIMSRPKGQKLIIKLNRTSGTFHVERMDCLCVNRLDLDTDSGMCTDKTWFRSYLTDRSSYKEYSKKGAPCLRVRLGYPETFHRGALTFTAADKDQDGLITFGVPFIDFAHELIHGLHFFRGTNRRKIIFRHFFNSPTFHLYNRSPTTLFADTEEYWTIKLAQSSENTFRLEHSLPLREGYITVTDSNEFYAKLAQLTDLAAKNNSGETIIPTCLTVR